MATNTSPRAAGLTTEDTFAADGLLAGDQPVPLTRKVTVKSGQNLARGAVIGLDSSGKALLSLSGASDGSQNPTAIMAEAVDATGGDKEGIAYIAGNFNPAALTFGTGHTAASTLSTLRDLNIYLSQVVAA